MDNKHVVKSPQIKSLSYLGIKSAKTHKALEKNPYYIEMGCKQQHIKQGMLRKQQITGKAVVSSSVRQSQGLAASLWNCGYLEG